MSILLTAATVNGEEKSDEQRLHDILFTNYNKDIQPTQANNKTVAFGIALIHLGVSEKESIMVTDLWLRFVWNEPKFKWNPEDYGNISVLRVDNNKIWKPDIVLYNK